MTTIRKNYLHEFDLKYGSNPHQKSAAIYSIKKNNLPFFLINGEPSYINILDAVNAWQLVKELDEVLKLPAATSFKHLSPAGAALGVDLDETLLEVYNCKKEEISPLATAYVRARGTDPLSSYGDFIGLSRCVDLSTANIIKKIVSDGVIAPDFEEKALNLLKGKKRGKYVVLKANPQYKAPNQEFREVNGVIFSQQRNTLKINKRNFLQNIVTKNSNLSKDTYRDLLLASITLKYTQSNSIAFAINGQTIGIGAGQQNRLDSVKLAGNKAKTWFLRQHPKILALPFKKKVRNVDRTNASIFCTEDNMTDFELKAWHSYFYDLPIIPTLEEKKEWITKLSNVSLSSDAFFPFRDNIDQAYKHGVKYVVQTGGSNRDESVIEAANEYGMVMFFSGKRLFHH